MCNTHSVSTRNRFDGRVEINRLVCREHYLLRVRLPKNFPATSPGQFIQIGCRTPNGLMVTELINGGEIEWQAGEVPQLGQSEIVGQLALLRRPFSLAGRGDDEQGAWVEIVYRVVGVGTSWLAGLEPGADVDLIGPLGNTFTLAEGKSIGLLVGGGVGLPPMFYTAELLKRSGWSGFAFVGAMTEDLLAVTHREDVAHDREGQPALSVEEFAKFNIPAVVTTDDGSVGMTGRITDGLTKLIDSLAPEQIAQAVIFTCGPNPMLRAVASIGQSHGIETQLCMEQAMACGMGTCQSCIVKIEDNIAPQGTSEDGRGWRYKLTCTDGPVFDSTQVVW